MSTHGSRLKLADGTELVFERHFEKIWSCGHSEPDPDWSFTDTAGHQHAWEGSLHPTLEERWEDDPYWQDEDDTPYLLGYFCKECGEKVTPGKKWSGEEFVTIEGIRSLYREGGVYCKTREEIEDLEQWSTHVSYGVNWAVVHIYQPLTPQSAISLIEAIGFKKGPVPWKASVIAMLREMGPEWGTG